MCVWWTAASGENTTGGISQFSFSALLVLQEKAEEDRSQQPMTYIIILIDCSSYDGLDGWMEERGRSVCINVSLCLYHDCICVFDPFPKHPKTTYFPSPLPIYEITRKHVGPLFSKVQLCLVAVFSILYLKQFRILLSF